VCSLGFVNYCLLTAESIQVLKEFLSVAGNDCCRQLRSLVRDVIVLDDKRLFLVVAAGLKVYQTKENIFTRYSNSGCQCGP
jgi:hypothetical protein